MPRRSKLLLLAVGAFALTGNTPPAPGVAPPQSVDAPASSAESLFAQGDLAGAEAEYAKALAVDPASAAALSGLARIRLYEGRESEARALASKALAAAPGERIATEVLSMADVRAGRFAPDRYRIDPQDGAVTAEFLITDPLPVIRVLIGGKERNFILDTGAPDLMILPKLAEELGLETTEGGEGVFAGGRRAPVMRTVVPEIEIGGLLIRDVPGAVMPAGGGLRLPNVEIDGILGTGVLMHFLSTIDYCTGRLVLAPRSDAPAFQARAASNEANVVPIWLIGTHFIFARGRINDAPDALFHIDTGLAGGGVSARREALDAAGVVIDESKVMTGMGGGGPVRIVPFTADITLGALTRPGVRGIHTLDGDPSSIFPFKTGGLISHGFFRQSRLTFDFDAMKLVTESC
jgi:hypothetical protein